MSRQLLALPAVSSASDQHKTLGIPIVKESIDHSRLYALELSRELASYTGTSWIVELPNANAPHSVPMVIVRFYLPINSSRQAIIAFIRDFNRNHAA